MVVSDVIFNGIFIGSIKDGLKLAKRLRKERREGSLNQLMNVYYNEELDIVEVSTEKGRARRPLIIIKDGKPLLTSDHIKKIDSGELKWNDLVDKGVIEYLDAGEEENTKIAINEDELTNEHTHLEISPLSIMGTQAAMVPYAEHNTAPRDIYGSKLVKQGLGVYASNYLIRDDTDSNILHYPQKPIVNTVIYDMLDYDIHPFGNNVVVAIMPWEGYNMEDAIVINKSSLERGLYRSTFFRPYKSEELKYAGGVRDMIKIPDKDIKGYRTEDRYAKLQDDGVIYPEAEIKGGDILIGKVSPPRFLAGLEEFRGNIEASRETSTAVKPDDNGIVDSIMISESIEGNKVIKVKVRNERVPEIGDKFATRYGQKGVIGMLVPQEDMPFTRDGIVPDIIFSPLSVPGRMTYAQLIECLAGKVASLRGVPVDGTPFDNEKEVDLRKALLKLGFRDNGSETLYDGRTGRAYKARIMIGNIFYMKLKYMVASKIQSRARGPLQLLTRQPTEGRAKEGGLRLGEMEKDCLIGHGASLFLKERFDSDKAIIPICKNCGMVAVYNKFKNKSFCHVCEDGGQITLIEMSYAFKLLLDELKSLCIYPKLIIDPKE